MTREEAIEVLQASSIKQMSLTKIIVDGKSLSVKVALDMAIKALEQEPRWIPVSERLPEDYETVIASVGHEYVYPEARYSKEYGWEWAYESGADYWQDLKGVDAWMPLPQSYKAESEGKE